MEDFLTFRRMITPIIIQILFFSGTAICVAAGFCVAAGYVTIVSEKELVGILLIFLAPFVLRILCEMSIVPFRINETLTDIMDHMEQKLQ